jgi:hypothetical protein
MKAWYLSKTLWLNIIGLLVLVLGQVTNTFHLSAQADGLIGMALTVLNGILRLVTTTSIGTPPASSLPSNVQNLNN